MVALLNLAGIREVVFTAPFFHTDVERVRARYLKFPKSELDFNSISRRLRRDGSTTIILPEYWSERFGLDLFDIYNSFANQTDLTLITANQDEVIDGVDYSPLKNCRLVTIDGKHDFEGEGKHELIRMILDIVAGK